MSLSTKIVAFIEAQLTKAGDLAAGSVPLQIHEVFNLTDGSGADQANQVWSDRRTISASSNETLDLSGVLTNMFGDSVVLTKVKALLIKAAAGNANDVVVGGAAANAFAAPFANSTDKLVVRPGGLALLVAPDANGYAVTAATADQLLVANSGAGTSVTYDIIIVGAQ